MKLFESTSVLLQKLCCLKDTQCIFMPDYHHRIDRTLFLYILRIEISASILNVFRINVKTFLATARFSVLIFTPY